MDYRLQEAKLCLQLLVDHLEGLLLVSYQHSVLALVLVATRPVIYAKGSSEVRPSILEELPPRKKADEFVQEARITYMKTRPNLTDDESND